MKDFTTSLSSTTRRTIWISYWLISVLLVAFAFVTSKFNLFEDHKLFRIFISSMLFIVFVSKVFSALFLFLEDFRRGVAWSINLFNFSEAKFSTSRHEFITKSSLIASLVPFSSLSFGIISGAHDYRVRKKTIYLKSLPKAFDGITIGQISDIHTGSFYNKTAVIGGVEMLRNEKPDIVCFTGDLVNNRSEEAKEYLDVFNKIKAPLGVFSVMGNHDYGDYVQWETPEKKLLDVKQLHQMHQYMGYDLLLNENRIVTVDGENIAVLGCENWGIGRFSKYGDLEKTIKGVEDSPFKILLSHDPSHWDAQICPQYSDIDLTLSGHTHGFQFGIEIGDFRWSPIQYKYKQWADLYQKQEQYLYVNRGFGFLGYPGRVGILPEITLLELKKA